MVSVLSGSADDAWDGGLTWVNGSGGKGRADWEAEM